MEIITRAEWGARYKAGYGPRPVGALERYLHHTVTAHLAEDATREAECAQMRTIEQIGQQRFGSGISYTLVIFPSGRVYEGAGIGRVSAHSGPGRNTRGAGLSLAGNYDEHPFGALVHGGLVALLRDGVTRGWWTSPTITEAHRQFKQTACPGKWAYAAIGSVNAAALRDAPPSRGDDREPVSWAPVVLPELINQRLQLAGFPTAGRPGDYDRAAVRRYQEAQVYPDLVADGLWGPRTELHFGWVVELQLALAKVGGHLNIDGSYGPQTRLTVENFQRAVGLVPDGQAGPITSARLGIRAHP